MKNFEEKPFFVRINAEHALSLEAASGKAARKDEKQTPSGKWPILIKEILDPQGPFLPKWNMIFIISCVFAVSLDPLFFYVPIIEQDYKCFGLDKNLKTTALVFRSITDLSYIVHIILKIRTLREVDTSGASGGSKVDDLYIVSSKGKKLGKDALKIAKKIWQSHIVIDILSVLPLPQVVILIFFSKMRGSRSLNTRKFLSSLVLLQYVPRVLRIYLSCKKLNKTPSVETGIWVKGLFNFFLYILASHVLGAFWYFFSIQRVTACWQYSCQNESGCEPSTFHCDDTMAKRNITFLNDSCPINPPNATSFDFGIFLDAIQSHVLESTDYPQKFLNCFWWGLRNLSSLGQNLQTSTYAWENLFAVSISIIGLLLFLYLIGNLQTYMQLSTTRSEKLRRKMKMKDLDIELWLSKNGLPKEIKTVIMENLQRKLEENKEVHVENLLSILPLEHKNNIKYHLCLAILKKVPMLQNVDEQVLKVFCENLKPVMYTEDLYIIREGEPLDKMLFITQGIAWAYTASSNNGRPNGLASSTRFLTKTDFYGEELLDWASKCTSFSDLPISTRIVKSHTKVEAFALKANDLKIIVCKFWWHFNKEMSNCQEEFLAASSVQATWRRHQAKRGLVVNRRPLMHGCEKSQNFSTPF